MTPRPTTSELAALTRNLAQVGEFWTTFELPLAMKWDDSRDDARILSANLIAEEFLELTDAKSRVDRLDAVCDLHYVSLGAMYACGFRADILKSYGYNRPLQTVIGQANTELRKNPPCPNGCRDKIPSLVVTTQRMGDAMFTVEKFNGAFAAVHKNNMEKLWAAPPQPHDLKDPFTVKPKEFLGGTVRYLVRRASDGKILKPANHKKVDLTPYI